MDIYGSKLRERSFIPAFGVQSAIVSTNHEMMTGRPPETRILRCADYPIVIEAPSTAEEADVLSGTARYMVAVGTENIQLSQPGNHAVGFIGDTPDHLEHYIFCTTHSVGPGTHIYHPWSNMVVDLGRQRSVHFPPDTTCVTWIPQLRQTDHGMPLRPYLPGEPCWIASMRYGGDRTFHLRIPTRKTIMSGEYAYDRHRTVCPVIDGDSEGIGQGFSGSAVIQRLPKEEYREGYGFVGGLHGLSIDNRIMFTPIPQELLSKYPRKNDGITTIRVQ